MTDELAATQPVQPTAAPVTADSAPAAVQAPVETPKTDEEPAWFKKRFGEITAQRYSEQRRAQAAEERAAQLERQLKERSEVEEKPKTLSDFEYDEGKYQSYLLDQAEKRAEKAARRVREEETQKEATRRREQKFNEKMQAFRTENPSDWELATQAQIDTHVVDALKDLDLGLEVAAFLGKNPELAIPLNSLSERQLAIQLGRLEERVERDRAANKAALDAAKAAKAVSQAPPPTPKIDGSNAQVDKDPKDMTDNEFRKWREKQIAARK